MDFHNVCGPFRAWDLRLLNSEERIYSLSEHRCAEKALQLLPSKQVSKDCHLFTVSDVSACAPQGCSHAAHNSHPCPGSCASRWLMDDPLCKENIWQKIQSIRARIFTTVLHFIFYKIRLRLGAM